MPVILSDGLRSVDIFGLKQSPDMIYLGFASEVELQSLRVFVRFVDRCCALETIHELHELHEAC